MKKSLFLTFICGLFVMGLIGSVSAETFIVDGPNELNVGQEATYKIIVIEGDVNDWRGGYQNAAVLVNGEEPSAENTKYWTGNGTCYFNTTHDGMFVSACEDEVLDALSESNVRPQMAVITAFGSFNVIHPKIKSFPAPIFVFNITPSSAGTYTLEPSISLLASYDEYDNPTAVDISSFTFTPFTLSVKDDSGNTTPPKPTPDPEPTFTLTFDVAGGSLSSPAAITGKTASTIILPTYSGVKDGFIFGGWMDGSIVYSPGQEYVIPASDVVLKAVWSPVAEPSLPDGLKYINIDTPVSPISELTVIPVRVENAENIMGFDVRVTYDESLFSISLDAGDLSGNFSIEENRIKFATLDYVNGNDTLFYINVLPISEGVSELSLDLSGGIFKKAPDTISAPVNVTDEYLIKQGYLSSTNRKKLITFDVPLNKVEPNTSVEVPVIVHGAQDLGGISGLLLYNPDVATVEVSNSSGFVNLNDGTLNAVYKKPIDGTKTLFTLKVTPLLSGVPVHLNFRLSQICLSDATTYVTDQYATESAFINVLGASSMSGPVIECSLPSNIDVMVPQLSYYVPVTISDAQDVAAYSASIMYDESIANISIVVPEDDLEIIPGMTVLTEYGTVNYVSRDGFTGSGNLFWLLVEPLSLCSDIKVDIKVTDILDSNNTDLLPYTTVLSTYLPVACKDLRYALSFDVADGSIRLPPSLLLENEQYVLPDYTGTKDGFIFDGWYDGISTLQPGETFNMPAHDVVLTAVWKAIPKFVITYDVVGGSLQAPIQEPLYAGSSFTLASYDGVKDGFTFVGWNDGVYDLDAGTTYTMPANDVYLTAIWEALEPNKTYNITYDVLGGSLQAPVQEPLNAGSSFILASYDGVKVGFTFAGWNDGVNDLAAGTDYTMPAKDVYLTAVWDVDQQPTETYNITYDVLGGSLKAPVQDPLYAGALFTLASYDGVKDGFTFAGWNDGVNDLAAGADYTMPAKDVYLKAVWNAVPTPEPTPKPPSSSSSGGSGFGSATVIQGTAPIPTQPTDPVLPTESEPVVTITPKPTPTPSPTPKPTDADKKVPGFELIGALAGLGAAGILMRRRKNN